MNSVKPKERQNPYAAMLIQADEMIERSQHQLDRTYQDRTYTEGDKVSLQQPSICTSHSLIPRYNNDDMNISFDSRDDSPRGSEPCEVETV